MIIPVRCVSCGKVLADKWREFEKSSGTAEGRKAAMDRLGLFRYCCRRHMMAHVQLVEKI